jgi:hypothetical protein
MALPSKALIKLTFWATALAALLLVSILVVGVIDRNKAVLGCVIPSAECRHAIDAKVIRVADPSQYVKVLRPRCDYLSSDVEGLGSAIVQWFHASEQIERRRSGPKSFFFLRAFFPLVGAHHWQAFRDIDLTVNFSDSGVSPSAIFNVVLPRTKRTNLYPIRDVRDSADSPNFGKIKSSDYDSWALSCASVIAAEMLVCGRLSENTRNPHRVRTASSQRFVRYKCEFANLS